MDRASGCNPENTGSNPVLTSSWLDSSDLVEHLPEEQGVTGSIPVPATTISSRVGWPNFCF